MVEIGDRAGLGQIRFGIFGLGDQLGVRHLDGDGPVQLLILSQIDEAEAPSAQHFLDPVSTDPPRAWSGCTFILLDGVTLGILRYIVRI